MNYPSVPELLAFSLNSRFKKWNVNLFFQPNKFCQVSYLPISQNKIIIFGDIDLNLWFVITPFLSITFVTNKVENYPPSSGKPIFQPFNLKRNEYIGQLRISLVKMIIWRLSDYRSGSKSTSSIFFSDKVTASQFLYESFVLFFNFNSKILALIFIPSSKKILII